jgi:hypothetical protein
VEFGGRVWLLVGRCPDLRFAVGLRGVVTDRNTDFRKSKCSDMRNGLQVDVRGVVQADRTVRATRVEVTQDDDDDDDDDE